MILESSVILLTGATGYIGGRLLRLLEKQGYRVRGLARRPEVLKQKADPSTEVVAGDLLDRASLDAALLGVDAAYYLVHSMGSEGSFEEADRTAASNFGQAAKAAGVKRIIYLGGLGGDQEGLSPHLRSRHEVGRILRESGVPLLEFRASVVIGSGSLSFEMIRSLVERLPIMITPKWVSVLAQPIAINDLLEYLLAALRLPISQYAVYEIGGADQVSYGDIMREYARQRGLRRHMLPVPVLTPYLSSLWLGLVTPLYARVGRKLIESIIHPTVVRDATALRTFAFRPMGIEAAIRRALAREEREFAETRWSDAVSASGEPQSGGGVRFGARLVDSRTVTVDVPAAEAFAPIQAIGGATGWYRWNWLWRLRGFLDLLASGAGMRRGRPHPTLLHVGDTVDFWRVEAIEPNRRLRLVAEMKLPGRAWLEFEVTGDGLLTTIRQTAIFDPVGWAGLSYWYVLFPLHRFVFAGMLQGIARAALHKNEVSMTRLSTIRQVIGLACWLLLSFAAAVVGAVASVSARIFYQQLLRPEWAPPAWVFGPVWSVLYLLMGIAAWLVWRQRGFRESGKALWLFIAQLMANALWTWLFFSWHKGALAFYEILILWVLLLCTVAAFWRACTLAGALLLPYLAWVTFATALCFAIWRLNPALAG